MIIKKYIPTLGIALLMSFVVNIITSKDICYIDLVYIVLFMLSIFLLARIEFLEVKLENNIEEEKRIKKTTKVEENDAIIQNCIKEIKPKIKRSFVIAMLSAITGSVIFMCTILFIYRTPEDVIISEVDNRLSKNNADLVVKMDSIFVFKFSDDIKNLNKEIRLLQAKIDTLYNQK